MKYLKQEEFRAALARMINSRVGILNGKSYSEEAKEKAKAEIRVLNIVYGMANDKSYLTQVDTTTSF